MNLPGVFSALFATVVVVVFPLSSEADIFRFGTSQVIPGTEGITPGPGVLLDQRNLRSADFNSKNLTGARFDSSDLTGAHFDIANLTDASLAGANLTSARFAFATLTNTNLEGAIVNGATFTSITRQSLTKEQLYSTASYRQKDLHGINIRNSDLTGWDLSQQDLTDANLADSTLTDVNLAGAVVKGTFLTETTSRGFTMEQLYSTASYQQKDLHGTYLARNDLTGWNLGQQNLINVHLGETTLTNTNLTGADTRGVIEAHLDGAILRNTILPDGSVDGLNLTSGEQLFIRNDHGRFGLFRRDPIAVTMRQGATISSGGVLSLLFDEDAWESTVSFQSGIPVMFGGTLELAFTAQSNVTTQVGRTLRIFDWSGVNPSGTFAVSSPYLWDTSRLYSTGEVTLIAVTSPDFNGDGSVNAADAAIMFGNWGFDGNGDLNGDHIVDAADAGILFSTSTGDTHAVPEPSEPSVFLFLLTIFGIAAPICWYRKHLRLYPKCPERSALSHRAMAFWIHCVGRHCPHWRRPTDYHQGA